MAADFDAKLTALAAEIYRDAVQIYRQGDAETWFSGYNPVITAWNSGMFGHLEMARSFQEPAGSPRVAAGSPRAVDKDGGASRTTLRQPFCLPRSLPAVRLPPPAELAALARSAPLMAKLDELARWLGRDGRPVTRDHLLHDADAADAVNRLGIRPDLLPHLWQHALITCWFDLVNGPDGDRSRVVLGRTAYRWADGDIFGALHVWAAVFASVLARTLELTADQAPEAAKRLNFQGQGVALAVIVFLARRTGLTMADASDIVQDGAIGDPPTGRAKRAWDTWVREFGDPGRALLLELAALRAVNLPPHDDGILTLSPLAQWALREQFMLDGMSIPVIPASEEEMSAADLIQLADVVSKAEFDAEFKSWFRRGAQGQAARELLMYAAAANVHERLTAVKLVQRTGKASIGAWMEALESRKLRGYAILILATKAADRPESRLSAIRRPDPDDLNDVASDLLTLIGDDASPERVAACLAEVIPAGSEEWVFSLLAQGGGPAARRVLEVLGGRHPDRAIARAARTAARAPAGRRPAPEPEGHQTSRESADYRPPEQARTQARNVQDARPSLPRR
jgi:hypothetical protein